MISKDSHSYRPEVDGLRAIAVVAVLLYHTRLGVPGGFLGVDVFFVISGYLMTRILRRSTTGDAFSLGDFWERRVRRLFPALAAATASTLGLGYLLLSPIELRGLAMSAIAQALLLANIYFLRNSGGYFDGPAERLPLLHTWSLAVEEQFYLLLPFFLLATRKVSDRALGWLIGALALGSFLLGAWLTRAHPQEAFYLLPSRAWELLLGGLLAILPLEGITRARLQGIIAAAGLAVLLLCLALYNNRLPFPGLLAAPPALATACILFGTASRHGNPVQKLLATRPMVLVGKISYSLYLIHWPLCAYATISRGSLDLGSGLAVSALSGLLAFASWKYIEEPFRSRTLLPRRGQFFAISAAVLLASLLVSVWFVASRGVLSRFPGLEEFHLDDVTWFGKEFELQQTREPNAQAGFPKLGLWGSDVESRLDLVVWGDSHGAVFSHVINEVARERGLRGYAANLIGVPPLPNVTRPRLFQPEVTDRVRSGLLSLLSNTPPRHLLLICRWGSYTSTNHANGANFQYLHLGEYPVGSGADGSNPLERNRQIISRNLQELAKFCRTRGIRLWILLQCPETAETNAAEALLRHLVGKAPSIPDGKRSAADHERQQAAFRAILGAMDPTLFTVVDPAPYLFDADGQTMNYRDGRAIYRDSDHLTRHGAQLLKPFFQDLILRMQRTE